MDKNTKIIYDELGRSKKVSNPQGIAQSYLAYLMECMEDKKSGDIIVQQLVSLFELIFHIKKGFYCPNCGKEISYEESMTRMFDHLKVVEKDVQAIYSEQFFDNEQHEVPKDMMEGIMHRAKLDFLTELVKCECGCELRDIFSFQSKGQSKKILIKNIELDSKDFDELRSLVPRQNILDYDGDKYIDPDLKEELEIKAKLQNKDYTSPTLEKQIVCVSVGTGLTIEYLQKITMRKLSLLLKTVDAKNMYYAQVQAAMSGMVKFKEDPKHWIFTDSKKNIKDELTSLENFEKKFEHVT